MLNFIVFVDKYLLNFEAILPHIWDLWVPNGMKELQNFNTITVDHTLIYPRLQ